ncbi:SpoIIE family protein phosphatase [Streptomyces sp. JB150]|uniref:SpoIIE family protein phosphatase n=1 Tax=Streptomyces sp. JB150 TaxID=2714844 RepID=UPI001F10F574|nr:SpoIIE family protein phosphatase [Streptomyces sp. JB150]
MTSESAEPTRPGIGPDASGSAGFVARQRAEPDRSGDPAAVPAVLERAKGALMALTGCSARAAHDELLRRARAGHRTLLEECRLLLAAPADPPPQPGPLPRHPARNADGSPDRVSPSPVSPSPGSPDQESPERGSPGPAAPSPGTPAPTLTPASPGPAVPVVSARDAGGPEDDAGMLERLGVALAGVESPEELARCLLEHLRPEVGADAVMVFARLPEGGLELIGHAGIDSTLAAQWRRVPPLAGIAALDALRTREPRWLEDIEQNAQRYLLIGDPPERWLSRAWLPVVTGDTAEVSIGVLRGRAGPFPPLVRERLRAVARLCAGRLRAFDTRPEPTARGGAAVQAVLDTLPGAAVLLSPLRTATGEIEDYVVEAASPETVDVAGRTGRELVGRRILECWPPLADETLWRGCAHTLATGEPYEGEPYGQRDLVVGTAELSTYRVRAARLDGGLVVSWVRYDPSDRQERRLADVQRLGNLGWANWNLVTEEVTWSAQAFAVLGRDPVQGPVRLADLPGLAVPEDAPVLGHALDELMQAGRRVDAPFRIRTASGVRHLRIVAEAVTDLRGAPVEVHGFLQDLTAQRRAELALVASERAMLTQHGALRAERALAGRLQHALLPLPDKPLHLAGLRVEVAYLPAQSGVQVGGDWFSAIELSDEAALLVVGDVAGHGVGAVATMAQLRFTAKGMVITGSSLTGALGRLNTLLLHSRDAHGMATLMLARYHARGRRLVWAQAGHPPPLLLRDGVARFLERPRGVLLGASAEPSFEEAECVLRPGDRLLLYTDGLVERPGEGIDSGLARLAEAAMVHDRDEPGSLEPLLTALLEGERRDDVCVLDIRVPTERDIPGVG